MWPMFRTLAASATFSLTAAAVMSAELPLGSAQGDIRGVLDTVGARIEASEEIRSNFKICPAEIAGASRSFWRLFFAEEPVNRRTCEADIQACWRICMDEGNASACLTLGYALEAAEPVASPLWAQMLFSQACAAGSSGGCTNRGAGLRNGQFDGDPLLNADPEELRGCLLRTFATACHEDDAWGCTMLGQSYQYGEGTPADLLMARRLYEKSCSMAEDFPACSFARKQLESLE